LNYQTPSEFSAGWRNRKSEGDKTEMTQWSLYRRLGVGQLQLTNNIEALRILRSLIAQVLIIKNYQVIIIMKLKIFTCVTIPLPE
jgi:hypothetical protein